MLKLVGYLIVWLIYIVASAVAAQILHDVPTFNGAAPDDMMKAIAAMVVLGPLLVYAASLFIWRSKADEYEKALFDKAAAAGATGGLVFMLIVELLGDFTHMTSIRVEMVPPMTVLYFMISMSRLKAKGFT